MTSYTIFGVVASMTVALSVLVGGTYGLVRWIMKLGVWLRAVADTNAQIAHNSEAVRINTDATRQLSAEMHEHTRILHELEHRVTRLEGHRSPD